MKKILFLLFTGSLFLASCKKDNFIPPIKEESCVLQTGNPAGRSYTSDSLISFTCTAKHCGILPLSTKNYWIYEDSVFSDGVFQKVQYDTLRFHKTWKSLSDELVWWESNISIGLPDKLYANDSAFFKIEDRFFTPGIVDVKKDFSLFPGDSIRYLASFEDAAAMGRSLKMQETIKTPAGSFSDYVYFEKNARNYRKDQVYFKPGVGVVKYIQEKAPMGSPQIMLQQVCTLISYHIE
ncbi:MAG: hypothetical protein IPN39_04960 [Chitinophagaceae bacterium]|nr:hypothetical protein [Chitinophagaceae bacterium]